MVDIGDAVRDPDDLPLQRLRDLRPRVPDDAHADLVAQVQPPAIVFQPVDDPQGLLIMPERPPQDLRQRDLPGVAKGRMPQVVAQGRRLGQVLIQLQAPGDAAGDAADLQGVGHPGAVVVALRLQKHLGLVHQAAECLTVGNAVHIPLVAGAHLARRLRIGPAPGGIGKRCPGR